jgi:hypothetical protein
MMKSWTTKFLFSENNLVGKGKEAKLDRVPTMCESLSSLASLWVLLSWVWSTSKYCQSNPSQVPQWFQGLQLSVSRLAGCVDF